MKATCPACNFSKDVRDELAGKLVKCPGCGERFRIGEAEGEFAVLDEPVGAGRKPAKKGRGVLFWVMLAALVPVLCCGGYVGLFTFLGIYTASAPASKAFGTVGSCIGTT